MESQSARLEREAEEARWQLSGTLEELRDRMTPGAVVDQVIDYTRDNPGAEFLRKLGRELHENPMPVVLIGIGIVWLLVASSWTSRAAFAGAADTVVRKAGDIRTSMSAVRSRTGELGQQTAARVADRVSDVASAVDNTTAELIDRAHDVTGKLTNGQNARLQASQGARRRRETAIARL
jgi:hypothetical protein